MRSLSCYVSTFKISSSSCWIFYYKIKKTFSRKRNENKRIHLFIWNLISKETKGRNERKRKSIFVKFSVEPVTSSNLMLLLPNKNFLTGDLKFFFLSSVECFVEILPNRLNFSIGMAEIRKAPCQTSYHHYFLGGCHMTKLIMTFKLKFWIQDTYAARMSVRLSQSISENTSHDF